MSQIVLVVATHNEGKKKEYELLLQELPVDVKGLSEFPQILEFSEQGNTFEEIAVYKARFTSKKLNIPALADDSGLAVEVLDGAPGIFSARYAGETASDHGNNVKLLKELTGKDKRNATFVCFIALAKPSGQALTYTGMCSGLILHEPVGMSGFGYDPLFYYPPFRKTFAQLTAEEKNKVSHRGQAMRKLLADFENVSRWLKTG